MADTMEWQERAFVVPEHVLVRELADEAVILNLRDECYLGLDPTAARMWQLLTESATVGDAYRRLLEEYEVNPERLSADLKGFLDDLERRDLVELRRTG